MQIRTSTFYLLDDWTLFSLAAIFSVVLPGSAILKAAVLVSLWAYLVYRRSVRVNSVLWFLSVLLQLVLWTQVGLVHNVPLPMVQNHAIRTLMFFVVLAIGSIAQQSSSVTQPRVDRLIAWMGISSALIKSTILLIVLAGFSTLEGVQSKLGFETVSDNIGFGLQRLQFPSDIILVFLIVSYVGGRSRFVDAMIFLGITVSVLLSFSRYLFVAYFVCLVLRAITLRKVDLVSRVSFLLGLVLLVVFSGSLLARIVGQGSVASDGIREQQMQQLGRLFVESPLFGLGLGSWVPGYTRSFALPFSYEVQWYAFAMQLGSFGLIWLLLNILLPLGARFQAVRHKSVYSVVILMWLAAGFTNPFITSLGSAFGLCLLMARMIYRVPDTVRPKRRAFQLPWMLAYASRRTISR